MGPLLWVILCLSSIFWVTEASAACTPERKAYATLSFTRCQDRIKSGWCFKGKDAMSKYDIQFFKDLSPESFDSAKSCSGFQTSCEFLKVLSKTCGDSYNDCHSKEERRSIMRMWIKQFIRETITKVGRFEEKAPSIDSGECDDFLSEFFSKDEVGEIVKAMAAPVKQKGVSYKNQHTNITYPRFGFLLDEEGEVIKFVTTATEKHYSRPATLPSHWEFCSWKLNKDLQFTTQKLAPVMPDLFHCDGKCNTNNGDDQEWLETQLGIGGIYYDRNTGTVETEEYMNRLERDINTCYMDAKLQFENTMCQRFEHFVTNCSTLIRECLGDVGIREVVMSTLLRNFGDIDYSSSECKEAVAAASIPSFFQWFVLLVILACENI